jgi:hypothetical protein
MLYCAEVVQCQQSIAPLKADGQKMGLPLAYNAEISATAPNYTAQCVAAQQAHITALFVGDIAVVITRVAQDCGQQGYHPIYVVDGLDAAATPTSAELIKGLTSLKGETLDGMAPPLTFTAGQPHPIDCWFTYSLKGGRYSLPNGTTTTCVNS